MRAGDGDASATSLRPSVEEFARASLAGEYYDPFDVDSKNFTQRSAGTLSWIVVESTSVGGSGSADPVVQYEPDA